MGIPTITVEIDGTAYTPAELRWILTAPCGCPDGACVVDTRDRLLLTEDDARDFFYESKAKAQRDKNLGFTLALRPAADAGTLVADCPHTPKWGIPARPSKEGHAWAIKHGARVAHLVPTYGKEPERGLIHGANFSERYRLGSVPSLCGSVDDMNWMTAGRSVPACVRCSKAATS